MNENVPGGAGSMRSASLIERVREGMEVVDAQGQRIGTVEAVNMGDPQAATTQGNEVQTTPGLVGATARAFSGDLPEPEVPEPLRSRLIRIGYIKVDGPNLFDTDRYVRADQIVDVAGNRVVVGELKSKLPMEE